MGDTIWDWDKTAANNATADSSINWAEGQLPSTVNNSAREMMAKIAYLLEDISSSLVTGGTGNDYTVSPGKPPSDLTKGWIGVVRFDRANTGAATFQVGSLTAASLVDAEGNALTGGEIVANGIYLVNYNPTNGTFHIVNRTPLHAGEVGTTQIADLAITTAKIADASITPAKIDSTGAFTVDSLTATTAITRGSSTIWGDDNFAARIAALAANTSPAGTESVACDDGQKVTLQAIAGLAGSAPDFISGALTIDTSTTGSTAVAHGLGVTPYRLGGYIKCNTAELGYSAGDIVMFPNAVYYYSENKGMYIAADSTNLYLLDGQNGFWISDKNTGVPGGITASYWDFHLFAWK